MSLLIDCGNSRIKWASFAADRLTDKDSASLLDAGADAWARLDGALAAATGRVLVASVAGPEIDARIAAALARHPALDTDLVVVEPAAHRIVVGYRRPETLGVDRWLAMIACRAVVDGAFVVIGAGTAVTIDAVDACGRHLGGLILAGERLMREALAGNTGRIPVVPPIREVAADLGLFGRSTEAAVGNGAWLALAAACDRAVAGLAAGLAAPVTTIMTGGDAAALAGWLETRVEIRADLVLEGLAILARSPE